MIGRRKNAKNDARHRRDDLEAGSDTLQQSDVGAGEGPWDSTEVGDPAAHNRIDLGGIWLPAVAGMELRLEVDEESGAVLSAICVLDQSAVQIRVLGAPRSPGFWQEMRADMAHEIREQGGEAREVEGPFGHEVHADMPAQDADGAPVRQQVRFTAVEKPRWLLQAVFTGAAVADAFAAAPLEGIVRDIVVVRGSEPMARGEALQLRLPEQATPEPRSGEDPLADGREPLQPFARGPEITEIN